jgi:hypothetical protein
VPADALARIARVPAVEGREVERLISLRDDVRERRLRCALAVKGCDEAGVVVLLDINFGLRDGMVVDGEAWVGALPAEDGEIDETLRAAEGLEVVCRDAGILKILE